jgi:hypothetical protein
MPDIERWMVGRELQVVAHLTKFRQPAVGLIRLLFAELLLL